MKMIPFFFFFLRGGLGFRMWQATQPFVRASKRKSMELCPTQNYTLKSHLCVPLSMHKPLSDLLTF